MSLSGIVLSGPFGNKDDKSKLGRVGSGVGSGVGEEADQTGSLHRENPE
jgi:hypothetical protein